MANHAEPANPTFPAVYLIATTDPVQGGAGGLSNLPIEQLVERTAYLKNELLRIPPTALNCAITGRNDGTTGIPTLLTTSSGLNVQLNASSPDPCVLTFPDGTNSDGQEKVIVKRLTANVPISNISNVNGDHLVYAQTNSTGTTIDLNAWYREIYYTPLPPASPSSGDLYFNYAQNKWYTYNGSSWSQVWICPVGVVTVASGSVTFTRTFNYGVTFFNKTIEPATLIKSASPYTPQGGYILAAGQTLDIAKYPRLYRSIGGTYGAPSGSTFKLPDYRGEFLRGYDNGRGVDTNTVTLVGTTTNGSPTISSITNVLGQTGADTSWLAVGMTVTGTGIPGGATITAINSSTSITISANATATGARTLTFAGRAFGQWQADQFRSHFHNLKKNNLQAGAGAGFFAMDDAGVDGSENTELIGGTETRPRNQSVYIYLKL